MVIQRLLSYSKSVKALAVLRDTANEIIRQRRIEKIGKVLVCFVGGHIYLYIIMCGIIKGRRMCIPSQGSIRECSSTLYVRVTACCSNR